MLGINKLLCLPKAELKTKNSTKRQLCCRLVEFLVFNSIYWKKTWPLFWDLPLLICMDLPKAELKTKNWVFGFQLDLLEKNLVTLPELTFTLMTFTKIDNYEIIWIFSNDIPLPTS